MHIENCSNECSQRNFRRKFEKKNKTFFLNWVIKMQKELLQTLIQPDKVKSEAFHESWVFGCGSKHSWKRLYSNDCYYLQAKKGKSETIHQSLCTKSEEKHNFGAHHNPCVGRKHKMKNNICMWFQRTQFESSVFTRR